MGVPVVVVIAVLAFLVYRYSGWFEDKPTRFSWEGELCASGDGAEAGEGKGKEGQQDRAGSTSKGFQFGDVYDPKGQGEFTDKNTTSKEAAPASAAPTTVQKSSPQPAGTNMPFWRRVKLHGLHK